MSVVKKNFNVLVLSESNPANDPRPNRIINHLKDDNCVHTLGLNATSIKNVKVTSIGNPKKRTYFKEIILYKNVFFKNYKRLLEIPSRLKIDSYLKENSFDIIFCHNLVLLPFVLRNKKKAKVIFDAREYYPKEFENNLRWKILFSGFNHWLCKNYLAQVDYMYTVSEGLANMYNEHYNVNCNVLMSYPKQHNLMCSNTSCDAVHMIYHGAVSEDRSIHLMIEMMDYVDDRFSLDLMLVKRGGKYYTKLENMIKVRDNINLIETVKFEEIITFTNKYDIGLYILPPTNFNTKHALPNKFFEFIQARLAIAIGPSVEMAELVNRYNLGVVSDDFNPINMANKLNKLTNQEISLYKENSHKMATIFNAQNNNKKIDSIISEII